MKKSITLILFIFFTLGLYSFTLLQQPTQWVVPESSKNIKNPTDKTNKEDLAIGKSLFSKNCQSCHGKEGFGDGTKAKEMKGDLGDFSSEKFQSQTDGALFYKMTKGRGDMTGFEKKIPDAEDRWIIINYIRTLKQ